MITLYGIENCDTVKKARKWLEQKEVAYRFYDFREQGMRDVPLAAWLRELGWEQVLNRRSTSWRTLSSEQKNAMDNDSAMTIALKIPTLIKRPVAVSDTGVLFGFKEAAFAEMVKKEEV